MFTHMSANVITLRPMSNSGMRQAEDDDNGHTLHRSYNKKLKVSSVNIFSVYLIVSIFLFIN